MKKVISTLLFIFIVSIGYSQTTYYWVGGATNGADDWRLKTSWSTVGVGGAAVGGTGNLSFGTADVLIFDGTNISSGTPVTGNMSIGIGGSYAIGQLIFQNGANVTFQRSTAVLTGTSTLSINGDGTALDDLIIDATSALTITSTTASYAIIVAMGNGATFGTGSTASALISGTVSIKDGNLISCRLITQNPNATITFASGSTCYVNNTVASSYPLGGSNTQTTANTINFKSGSNLVFQGGNSVFGTNTAFTPIILETGSNFIFEAIAPSGIFNSRTFSNVIVRPLSTAPTTPVVVAVNSGFYNIDNLTIQPLATFNLQVSGVAPISGNILNNGTFGVTTPITTSNLAMVGSTPQTIGGSGIFTNLGLITIGTDADVTINTNLNLTGTSTASVTGKLNMQNFVLSGTSPFQLRAAATATSIGTLTAGSNTVTLNSAVYATGNVANGMLVTGTGIQPNTYVIGTNSSTFQFTISKPATVTTATDAASITLTGNPATLVTSNAAGVDGTIATTSTRNFGSGSNYIFNAATTTPFSAGSTTNAGNVTINANVTTNRITMGITGTLTLNTGKLTIRPTDTLRITTGTAIAGSGFSTSKYIVTDNNGTSAGVLRIENFTTARTLPIGSATNYMPVTLTPTTSDAFAASVFEGITADATPAGTAFTAAQKAMVVNAVWIINRVSANTDNCAIAFNWPASLEGSSFASFGNSIGVAGYASGWGTVGGSGDNTANTATNSFNTFGGFGVGKIALNLPVKFTNVTASEQQGKIKVDWKVATEINTDSYVIERSINGTAFTEIGKLAATNNAQYSLIDNTPSNNINYYRIKAVDKNGSFDYSSIVQVKLKNDKAAITVYPNPVKGNQLNLQLSNLAKGNVELKLYNNLGQQLLAKTINYTGGSQTQTVQLPSSITKGIYKLVVATSDNNNLQQTVLVD